MRQISETLQVSQGLVLKVVAIHRTYGMVTDPTKQRTGRPREIDNDAAQYLEELLAANPNMYLDELQQRLEAVLNLNVSIATISRTLHRLAITRKRVSKAAAERDEDLRLLWRLDIAQYEDPEMFVFLDESAVDNHTVARTHGWSAEGLPCVKRGTFLRGTRFSILPALSLGGILALEIFEGSVTKERFLSFLREYIVSLYFMQPRFTSSGAQVQPMKSLLTSACCRHHSSTLSLENGALLSWITVLSIMMKTSAT